MLYIFVLLWYDSGIYAKKAEERLMLCPKCGIYNAESAQNCLRCGVPLPVPQPKSRKKKARRQKSSSGIGAMVTVGIFIVLSIVMVVLTFAYS